MKVDNLPFNAGIGGHAITTLMGYNKYKTPLQLWEELTHKRAPEQFDNLLIDLGAVSQPMVLKHWARENNVSYFEDICIVDDDYDFMNGHLDGIKFEYVNQNPLDMAVIEVKCVFFGSAYDFGKQDTCEVPTSYITQSAWYCGLTKLPQADILVLANGQIYHYIYERDETIEEALREAAKNFWFKYVLKDCPPPPANLQEMNRYYKSGTGKAIQADDEILNALSRYVELKAVIKSQEEELNNINFYLKKRMQDNEEIEYNGKVIATAKIQVTNRIDTDLVKTKYKEIYEDCITQHLQRPLRVK